MDELQLIRPTPAWAEAIATYRASFPDDRTQVTADPDRIPGLDGLEEYDSVPAWLAYCATMEGRISWYMAVRKRDGKIVGFCCLRHRLEYDDDDPPFASHIGYSVRPEERGKGYAKEALRLLLREAKKTGLDTVRVICRDLNEGSRRTILANGGRYVDTVRGEESGLTVLRFDVPTG